MYSPNHATRVLVESNGIAIGEGLITYFVLGISLPFKTVCEGNMKGPDTTLRPACTVPNKI